MREKVNVQKFVGKSNGKLLKILAPNSDSGRKMVQRLRRKHEIRGENDLPYLAPNSDSGRKWPSVSDAQNAKSGFLVLLQTFLGRFYV